MRHPRPLLPLTLGLRREDPKRIWERRAPLTPDVVHHLVSRKNVRVHIEHCDRRVFPDQEYVKAGATVTSTLDDAHVILGIKETPLHQVITNPAPTPSSSASSSSQWTPRTHLMFSHTIKGQAYNTPLLARFVAPSAKSDDPQNALMPHLIDYELLTDADTGKRTVGFGWFAGVAGVLESLSAMAHSHLESGIASPFLYTPRPHTHPSLDSLRTALRAIGHRIAEEGTPSVLGPFVIGLTGTGNVSQGCLSMLSELPIAKVHVKDLHSLVTNKDTDLKKIYLAHALPEDYLVRTDGRKYDRTDYYAHPELYTSNFAKTVAPYLTLFLNGAGWGPAFPRLMTNSQLETALRKAQALGGARFTNVGDISCDVEGGLEFLTRSTTLSAPFYKVRPKGLPMELPAVQLMSVDILPASLPLDASRHFAKALTPYLENLVDQYASASGDLGISRHGEALERATVARGGRLVERHEWLQDAVDKYYQGTGADSARSGVEVQTKGAGHVKKKRLLLLGSGMVAGPAVEEIARRNDVELVIASNSEAELKSLVKGCDNDNVRGRVVDMSDREEVGRLVQQADVVISLLPVALHKSAAELCVKHGKHLVTASYISDGMRSLHDSAVSADVLLLNEIGLDPGIDHCSAISLVNQLHAEGKEILSFTSFCGGLPAPDVRPRAGPLGYKFSWSPRGVLSAALNSARFKLSGNIYEIPGRDLLRKYFPSVPVTDEFALEGIANRDSLPYAQTYNLGRARTVLRGTLRYPGFSDLMQSFKSLGLLQTEPKLQITHWMTFVQQCIELQTETHAETRAGMKSTDLLHAIEVLVPRDALPALVDALRWLSLLPVSPEQASASTPLPPLPAHRMAPIDWFAYLLAHKMRYEPGERDMVVLAHEVVARPVRRDRPVSRDEVGRGTQGQQEEEEIHTASLITYGTPSASAMARTVGLPVAIAALNVLDGKVRLRGVAGPGDRSVYEPVLQGLERVGLGMQEACRVSVGGEGSLEKSLAASVRA